MNKQVVLFRYIRICVEDEKKTEQCKEHACIFTFVIVSRC